MAIQPLIADFAAFGVFACVLVAGGCRIGHVLPELDAAIDGVTVGSEGDVAGKILHQLGVAAAKENGVADQRGPEAFDDVEN